MSPRKMILLTILAPVHSNLLVRSSLIPLCSSIQMFLRTAVSLKFRRYSRLTVFEVFLIRVRAQFMRNSARKSKRKVKTGMSEFSRRLLSPSIWLSHTVFVGNHGKEYSIQNQEKVPCDQKRGSVQAGGDEASGGVQQPSAGEHVPEQAVG